MHIFLKKYSYFVLFLLLFIVGSYLRFYNLPMRLVYGPEQGISLLTSAANMEKFSLLGEYNLQRFTSDGHNLIHGPLFSYFLLPFILLFNFRILPLTIMFVLLNLFTALTLFIISKKLFGKLVAILSLFYFLTSTLMIYHSLFIWIYNPLILLGVLSVWLINSGFWLGLISGIGFNLQYPFLVYGAFLFLVTILISKRRLKSTILFIIGFCLANITRVIFDIRHDFYHIRTLWQFFVDVYINHSISAVTYNYHYLHLFPIFCLLLAFFSVGLYKIKKPLVLIPILIYLYFNFTSPLFNLDKSLGMPNGLTLSSLESAASVIAADKPPVQFNVATLWDFDTRAHPLRYLLKYYHHIVPAPVENYKDVSAIYVFAPESRDIYNPDVWELNVFRPYKIISLSSSSYGYKLYKLVK